MSESVKPGKRPPCQSCGRPAFYLCDYPVRTNGVAGRCSRPLCKGHAHAVGAGAHYCPPHERASRPPVVQMTRAPARECPHSWYDPGCRCGRAPIQLPEADEVSR